jgi:hypothetical protein
MPYPEIGRPLPRAADAYTTDDKWRGWILAERGHGHEWARVFGVGPNDSEEIWRTIADGVIEVPVVSLRDRAPHGIVCATELLLTINHRSSPVAAAWHYADEDDAPRLVTAYPRP